MKKLLCIKYEISPCCETVHIRQLNWAFWLTFPGTYVTFIVATKTVMFIVVIVPGGIFNRPGSLFFFRLVTNFQKPSLTKYHFNSSHLLITATDIDLWRDPNLSQ